MDIKFFLIAGALLASISVAIGALGAHWLKDRLEAYYLNLLEIGVRYQIYHSLGLIALALSMNYFNHEWITFALGCMLVGTILFSFSLYAFALTRSKYWIFLTPIGGTLLVISWITYALGVVKS